MAQAEAAEFATRCHFQPGQFGEAAAQAALLRQVEELEYEHLPYMASPLSHIWQVEELEYEHLPCMASPLSHIWQVEELEYERLLTRRESTTLRAHLQPSMRSDLSASSDEERAVRMHYSSPSLPNMAPS